MITIRLEIKEYIRKIIKSIKEVIWYTWFSSNRVRGMQIMLFDIWFDPDLETLDPPKKGITINDGIIEIRWRN